MALRLEYFVLHFVAALCFGGLALGVFYFVAEPSMLGVLGFFAPLGVLTSEVPPSWSRGQLLLSLSFGMGAGLFSVFWCRVFQ